MTPSVSREQLRQIPHVNGEALGDRAVNLMPLWDGEKWLSWVPIDGGNIIQMPILGVAEGNYLAKTAQLNSDLFVPFVDLMWQRASWPEIVPFINAMEDDFRNMGTSIAKLKHIFQTRNLLPPGACRAFAATELEYLIVLCRTVFDLLQEIIAQIWHARVVLLDPAAERSRKAGKLPDTFSRMCLRDNNPRSTSEMEGKCGLPGPLAEQYAQATPFFIELRELRNGIVHHGTEFDHIFDTERGFCIRKDSHVLSAISCRFTHEYNEHLVSILPFLSTVIMQTISTCTSLVNTFASLIQLPEAIAPSYHVFVRGPHTSALLEVLEIYNGASPWWGIL
jgi:hypothetical protein